MFIEPKQNTAQLHMKVIIIIAQQNNTKEWKTSSKRDAPKTG